MDVNKENDEIVFSVPQNWITKFNNIIEIMKYWKWKKEQIKENYVHGFKIVLPFTMIYSITLFMRIIHSKYWRSFSNKIELHVFTLLHGLANGFPFGILLTIFYPISLPALFLLNRIIKSNKYLIK